MPIRTRSTLPGAVGLLFLLMGCSNFGDKVSAVVFPAHPSSWHTRGELVEVRLSCADTDPRLETRPEPGPRALPAAGAAMAAEMAIDAAIAFLQEESERYTATYSGVAVGDAFYDASGRINLTGITMQRLLGPPKTEQPAPGTNPPPDPTCEIGDLAPIRFAPQDTAMSMSLAVKPTRDQRAFLLVPEELTVRSAKAKLHWFNWFEPWTWFGFGDADDDIDVVVKVVFHAAWVNKDGKGAFEKIAEGEFQVRNLQLGRTYRRGGTGDPDCREEDCKPLALPAGALAGQLIPAIPRSVLPNNEFGSGNFVVSILVTEVDDYGSKIKEQADRLAKEREGLIERMTSFAE